MTNLRQSFKAARYHKRMTISLFIVFSLFLLLLSYISQLIDTQKFTLSYLLGKWDQLKHILPQFDTELNNRLGNSNDLIMAFYEHLRLLILVCSFIAFFFISLYFTHSRKEEIYSLNYIGIKRREMLPGLLLELFFPIILSLPVIFCILLVFHSHFLNESIQTNQKVMRHYFESEQMVPKKRENVPVTNTNESEKKLLPYNQTSILDVNITNNSNSHVFTTLLTNFILLCSDLIIAYTAGFYCYTTFGLRRRKLVV